MAEEKKKRLDDDGHGHMWERIELLQDGQTEMRTDFGVVNTKVDALISEFRTFSQAVYTRLNEKPERMNWIALSALVVSILIAAGAYLQARLEPIESTITSNATLAKENAKSAAQSQYSLGYGTATQESHSRVIEKLTEAMYDTVRSTQANTTKIDALENWLKAVDDEGSRKHVISAPDAMIRGR